MSKSTQWRDQFKGYSNIHIWMRKNYGRPRECEHCNSTEAKAYDWALIKGKEYAKDRSHFIRLCRSCHKKYDMSEKTREKCRIRMLGNTRNRDHLNKAVVLYNAEEYLTFKSMKDASAYLKYGCRNGDSKSLRTMIKYGLEKRGYKAKWMIQD